MPTRSDDSVQDSSVVSLTGYDGCGGGVGSPPRRSRATTLACVFLVLMVVALALRVRALDAEVGALTARLRRAEQRPLERGQSLGLIELLDVEGRATRVEARPGESGVLLLVSSLACGACDDVRVEWDRARAAAEAHGVRVMELVLDGEGQGLDGASNVYRPGPGSRAFTRSLPAVPTALVLDAAGAVQRAYYGSPHEGLTAEVEGLWSRRGALSATSSR